MASRDSLGGAEQDEGGAASGAAAAHRRPSPGSESWQRTVLDDAFDAAAEVQDDSGTLLGVEDMPLVSGARRLLMRVHGGRGKRAAATASSATTAPARPRS